MENELTKQYTQIVSADNGVGATGIALFGPDDLVKYEKFPTKSTLNYQKEEAHITRVDVPALRKLFQAWNLSIDNTLVVLERPMINGTRFKASMSAMRCFEATLIVIEEFQLDYIVIDSRSWQSILLPGIIGSDELKKASLALGQKLFPQFKQKRDSDSLLIGYYYKNQQTLTPLAKSKTKKTL